MIIKEASSTLVNFDNKLYSDVDVSNGQIKLKVSNVIGGTNYYSPSGTVEFQSIDLGKYFTAIKTINSLVTLPSGCSYKVYTSTSNDNFNFSPYVQVNSNQTIASPQGQYVKIKLEIFGADQNDNQIVNYVTTNQINSFRTNNDIDFSSGLNMKNSYSLGLSELSTFENGDKLFSKKIDKSQFKYIKNIEVNF